MDDAPVRRVRYARRDERTLSPTAGGRRDGLERRLRPADADGPRPRPRALSRRGWQGRGKRRLARRHGGDVRSNRSWCHYDVDDDQCACGDNPGDVPGGGRAARGSLARTVWDDSERRPQGVHCAKGVHLSSAAVDAPDHRHLCVLRRCGPEVEHDLGERIPHAGSWRDRCPGTRLHAAGRDRIRAVRPQRRFIGRRVRTSDVLLLQYAQRLLRRARQVPCGAEGYGRR